MRGIVYRIQKLRLESEWQRPYTYHFAQYAEKESAAIRAADLSLLE